MKKCLMVLLVSTQIFGSVMASEQSTGQTLVESGDLTQASKDSLVIEDSVFSRATKGIVELSSDTIEDIVVYDVSVTRIFNKMVSVDPLVTTSDVATAPIITALALSNKATINSNEISKELVRDLKVILDARIDTFTRKLKTALNITSNIPRAVVMGYLRMPLRMSQDTNDKFDYAEDVEDSMGGYVAFGALTADLVSSMAKNISSAATIELADEKVRAQNLAAAIKDARKGDVTLDLLLAVEEIQHETKCSREEALEALDDFAGSVSKAIASKNEK